MKPIMNRVIPLIVLSYRKGRPGKLSSVRKRPKWQISYIVDDEDRNKNFWTLTYICNRFCYFKIPLSGFTHIGYYHYNTRPLNVRYKNETQSLSTILNSPSEFVATLHSFEYANRLSQLNKLFKYRGLL